MCELAAGSDEKWLDSFLHESYKVPEVLARVRRGPGFCSHHGQRLLARGPFAMTIAVVHQSLVREARARLAESARPLKARGGRPEPEAPSCAACAYQLEAEARAAFFLARFLHTSGWVAYARPGAACVPHLPLLAARIANHKLMPMIETHIELTAEAKLRLAHGSQGPFAVDDQEVARWVRRVVGDRPPWWQQWTVPAQSQGARDKDPVRRFRRRLSHTSTCPVCAELADSLTIWMLWLDGAAAGGHDIDDVLPLCRRHVWAAVAHGGPALKRAVARCAVQAASQQLDYARRALARPAPSHPLWIGRVRAWRDRARAPSQARALLARVPPCAVCRRMLEARTRAIALLCGLLEERAGRAAFERGYGLCVPHALRALAIVSADPAGAAIRSVTRARLAVHGWELEEQVRKASWSARPEGRGAEAAAWRRAVLRFSGGFPTTGIDP